MKKLFAIASLLLATSGFRVVAHAGEEATTDTQEEQQLKEEASEINKTPSNPQKDLACVWNCPNPSTL